MSGSVSIKDDSTLLEMRHTQFGKVDKMFQLFHNRYYIVEGNIVAEYKFDFSDHFLAEQHSYLRDTFFDKRDITRHWIEQTWGSTSEL